MEADFNRLVEILSLEYEAYQFIYRLSQKKQQVIITEDLAELNNIVAEEEDYLQQIEELESKRIAITGEKSILELMEIATDSTQISLKSIQHDLLFLIEDLSEQNRINERLIKDVLQLTNFNINLLTDNDGKGTYDRNSKLKIQQGQRNIINKQA